MRESEKAGLTARIAGVALLTVVLGLLGTLAYVVATFEPDAVLSVRKERFTLVDIDPPKHFYVDLRDSAGAIHRKVYVSKHCNSWRSLRIGQDLDLDIVTYAKPKRRGGTTYDRIETGRNAVCPATET